MPNFNNLLLLRHFHHHHGKKKRGVVLVYFSGQSTTSLSFSLLLRLYKMPTASSFLFPLTVVLTCLLLQSLPSCAQNNNSPDPYCLRGLCSGPACCPAACGQCGGPRCHRRVPSLGSDCCSGFIRNKLGRSCDTDGPPCLVQPGKRCQVPPPSGGGGPNSRPTSTPSSSPSPNLNNNNNNNNIFTTPRWTGKGTWTTIQSTIGSPTARHENCFVMVNGKAYLIGGRGTRPVEEYNPISRTWRKVADMPVQMHHMQCVAYENSVYIVSAWYGSSPNENNVAKLWIFHTDTFTWESRAGLPSSRRRGGAAAVLFDDRIYVLCGNRGGHGPPSRSLGWVDYYDLKSKQWTIGLADIPEGHERDHVGGARINNMICIAGGRNGGMENPFAATVESTFCYIPKTDSWRNMRADIPKPRAGAATGRSCDGRLMIVGGEGRFSPAFDRVDLFDGKEWESVGELKRSRHGTGIAIGDCEVCEHVIVVAGSGRRGGRPELNSTEVYVPTGRTRRCTRY